MKALRAIGILLVILACDRLATCSEISYVESGFRPTWGVEYKFSDTRTRLPFRIQVDRKELTFLLLASGKSEGFWMLNTYELEYTLSNGKSGLIQNMATRPHRWIPILANANAELIVEVAVLEYSVELAELLPNGAVTCRLLAKTYSPNDTGTKLINSGLIKSAPFEIIMKDGRVWEARVPLDTIDDPEFGLRNNHSFRNKNSIVEMEAEEANPTEKKEQGVK